MIAGVLQVIYILADFLYTVSYWSQPTDSDAMGQECLRALTWALQTLPPTLHQGRFVAGQALVVLTTIARCTSATSSRELGRNKLYYSRVLEGTGTSRAHRDAGRERESRALGSTFIEVEAGGLGSHGFTLY